MVNNKDTTLFILMVEIDPIYFTSLSVGEHVQPCLRSCKLNIDADVKPSVNDGR